LIKINSISRYAWLPIPIFIGLIFYAEMSGISYTRENRLLLLISNIMFTAIGSFLILYLISRSFLIYGRIGLILFGSGVFFWGFSGLISTLVGYENSNVIVTIHNLCAFFSSILYLLGAIFWSRKENPVKFPGLCMTAFYSISLLFLAFIVLMATAGKTPLFFVEQKGGTAIRYVILTLTVSFFVITAILLRLLVRKGILIQFLHWYSLSIVLISIGIVGIMLDDRMGDLLCWTGRSAQFIGGLYMIIAAFTLVRETNGWAISLERELNNKRQLAEDAQRKSERRYQQIVELAGEGIIQTDEKFAITEWNRAAEKLYGWKAEEVIGRNSHSLLRSNIHESRLKDLLNELNENGVVRFEATQYTKENTQVIIEENLSVIKDHEGKISGYISVNRDITDRVKAQEILRHAKEETDRSEKRLRIALENANIGLWEWDFTKNELIWDERTEMMFGLVPGTFEKTLEAFEELVLEDDIQRVRTAYKNSIEKGILYEVVFRTGSIKNPKHISSKAFVANNKDGHPQSMLGVCFDVTSFREETDKAIIKLNQELSRSNRDLENFAYVASHDLQEPLRMVTSFTQLLQMKYADKLDEDANTYINYAVGGTKHMYELLNGLLEYSRIRTRGREFTQVDMNEVITQVKSSLRLKLEETAAVINCDQLPTIMADRNQMVQIMQNLVENGIKFSRNPPVLTISARDEAGYYIFSAKDKGIGIEPQYYDRIFRIFQRLHTKNEYVGMGIGLSICQRIVERHGGKIWVESTPGKGSTFFFSIPIQGL
jgi:PAS domain S-box-containing protein